MDKQQAQQIIRNTFENPYNKSGFNGFIKNLLNRIDNASFTYQGSYIPDAYKQYIKTLERIGKFSDGENSIDILVITLQKETSLERARTMQRNFIAWYLNGSRGGEMKDAAIVAFVSPGAADWRFSLVKMDYKFEKAKTGRMKVKEEFTPARRWSFLVGANEKSHTAQSRLVNILADDEQAPTLVEFENAFDIETVTKEFFIKYRELFLRTKEELDKVVKKYSRINNDFKSKGVNTVNFAKKLLGQIVFLYFLQKKGWFGVGRDADWGEGSKHFLRELFERKHGNYNNFFNDILEPLFYEALRIDRSFDDNYYSRFNCKIPFLNGGLFDPICNYDWVHTDILLPDKLFSNTNKTKEGDSGDGILDILDRYNFTVKEDEPLEKEVAIDPELLGKAYEKFNAIRPDNFDEFRTALKSGRTGEENKFNKKFGVYYTPREIVHYMCQQSLINYLDTTVNKQKKSIDSKPAAVQKKLLDLQPPVQQTLTSASYKPILPKEDIEMLIQIGEQVSENEARVIRKGKETRTYSHRLPESIRKNAKLIDEKLAEITVCDPAVGSGAFPVGMMNEIARARNVMSPFVQEATRTTYEFKRRCIEHSLYGVDIDPGAVEIAKLRLWLSLVVDEDELKSVKPLPNLDYKIVCGNSLLGYPYAPRGLKKIEKLKNDFFSEVNPTRKNQLRNQIDNAIYGLFKNSKKSLGYTVKMDFKINFSEVFQGKGGFDVVIANPPYVEFKNLEKSVKNILETIYTTTKGKYDLYIPFLEKNHKIANRTGFIIYICPTRFMQRDYGKNIRNFIRNYYSIKEIIDFSDVQIFEGAINYTGIFSFINGGIDNSAFLVKKASVKRKIINIEELLCSKESTDSISVIQKTKAELIDNAWYFQTDKIDKLLQKVSKNTNKLGDISDGIYQGIATGKDEVFLVNKKTVEKYNLERNLLCPILKGKDISRYKINWRDIYLIYTYDVNGVCINEKEIKSKTPNIYSYLQMNKKKLSGRSYFNKSTKKWYELWNQRNLKRFKQIKIITLDNAKRNSFCLDEDEYLTSTTGYSIILKNNTKSNLLFTLGILNSKLIDFYHKQNTIPQAGGFYRYQALFINKLPITKKSNNKIIKLVSQILAFTKSKDYLISSTKQSKVKDLEAEIDQFVYKLYSLTLEEIKVVEGKIENTD